MSENYGKCKNCGGMGEVMSSCPVLHVPKLDECHWCHGTGFDSSARAYLIKEDDRYPPELLPPEYSSN